MLIYLLHFAVYLLSGRQTKGGPIPNARKTVRQKDDDVRINERPCGWPKSDGLLTSCFLIGARNKWIFIYS